MSTALDYTPQKFSNRTFANLVELFVLDKFDCKFDSEFMEHVNLDPNFIMSCLFHENFHIIDIKVGTDEKQLWQIIKNTDTLLQIFKWADLTVSIGGQEPKMVFSDFMDKFASPEIKAAYLDLDEQDEIKFVQRLYQFEFIIRFI